MVNKENRAPAEAQRSGFGGKRRRSGMSEFSPLSAEMSDMELAVTKSSRLWVCQGIKLQFACIRDISEKGTKNQTLCGPDENDAAQLTGRLQNGLVRLSIPEDSEDHSGHLSADMTNHIHVMQTFGYFLFVIGLKHRITMHATVDANQMARRK